MGLRHFLTLNDITPAELELIIQRAIALKKSWRAGDEIGRAHV